MDEADLLIKAVRADDVETSLRILQKAGDACQVRDLVQEAHKRTDTDTGIGRVVYSIKSSGNMETLGLYHSQSHAVLPIVELEQANCKR